MTKQNTTTTTSSTVLTVDEIEVLEVLVELPRLILESVSRNQFPFTWGCKRRRSAINVSPSPSPLQRSSSPSVPSLLHHASCGGARVVASSLETKSPPVVKVEATSPATPLSFSPSTESDEKPRRKLSLKRKREDYQRIIEELEKDNDSLLGEIKKVERYRDQLKDFNLKLKARKQELSDDPKRENEKNPSSELSFQMQIVHASLLSSNSIAENQDGHPPQSQLASTEHYVPSIVNQTVVKAPQISGTVSSHPTTSLAVPCSSSVLGMGESNMGPVGTLPDLNVSLEEPMGMGMIAVECCQPLDMSAANKNIIRAMATQARQKRLQIYRGKNPIGISKMRHSCR